MHLKTKSVILTITNKRDFEKEWIDVEKVKNTVNVMNRSNNVGIGIQDFLKLREQNHFYIDKTSFIKEWWESGDDVTLITRPRRFGKT